MCRKEPVIRHEIQNKKPVCRTSKAFVTTGRLPRKIASSKSTKSRPILALGKSKSSPGIVHKTEIEEDSLSLEFAASHAGQKASNNFKAEERTFRIPTAGRTIICEYETLWQDSEIMLHVFETADADTEDSDI